MARTLVCDNPECGEKIDCFARLAGEKVKCPRCATETMIPFRSSLPPSSRLGNYTIVRQLGRGGMGTVYEAIQQGLNRRVALKVLSKRLMRDPAYLERFQREAQSAAVLSHPNIVTVYENGQEEDHWYFSMELVDGETLGARLGREQRLPLPEAVAIATKVAAALEHAWKHGAIIHRDIKPENVILTGEGEPKIADLGLAKSVAEDTGVTREGEGLGTPNYMAPEQSRGVKEIDCRADIYSLGIMLYEMVTGTLPFVGETPYAVVLAHVNRPLPDPKSVLPALPGPFCALLHKMCAKLPDRRFQNPSELLAALQALGNLPPVEPAGPEIVKLQAQATVAMTASDVPSPEGRRSVWRAVGAFGIACAFLLGGAFLVRAISNTKSSAPPSAAAVTTVPAAQAPRDDPPSGGEPPASASESDRLRELYEYAAGYAKSHPEEYVRLIQIFRAVEMEARGTKYALMAQEELRKVNEARKKAAEETLKRLEIETRELMESGRVAEAFETMDAFPTGLRPCLAPERLTAWKQFLRKMALRRFNEIKKQADARISEAEFGKARELYAQARAYGLPEVTEEVIELLEHLAGQEALARGKRQKEAEGEYEAALGRIMRLARDRNFSLALRELDATEEDGRFAFLAERTARDRADLLKAKAVYDAAVQALASRIGKATVIGGTEGVLKAIDGGNAILEVDGKAVPKPLAGLPNGQVAELATPAMKGLGGEGSLRMALFWICQGDRESVAVARRHLAGAEAEDLNVQRYVELCDRLAGGPDGSAGAEGEKRQLYTSKELAEFKLLYGGKLGEAATSNDLSVLAKEMLGAAGEFEAGMKFLLLDGARQLAVESGDHELATAILKQLAALATGHKKAYLVELLEQQLKLLDQKTEGREQEEASRDKVILALAAEAVENTILLCRWRLSDTEYDGALEAVDLGLRASRFRPATEALFLKKHEALARKLSARLKFAEEVRETDVSTALWAYLDASAAEEAKRLTDDSADERAMTIVQASGRGKGADERLLEAAKAWELHAESAKGTLRQIRLMRAAGLYLQRLLGKRDEPRSAAKARLQAVSRELGEMFGALRKPRGWGWLVDYPIKSSKVGWDRLHVVTRETDPLAIAGHLFQTGYRAHAYSEIVFDLNGQYREFTTSFGLQDGAGGAAKFKIACDGKVVYDGPFMWRGHDWAVKKPVTLNVVGVDRLALISEFHRNPAGAFSAWGGPRLR